MGIKKAPTKLVGTFWSGRQDSNLRPPAPKAGAIPGYATPRGGESGIRTRGTIARTAV